jgi:putative flippase GtrA
MFNLSIIKTNFIEVLRYLLSGGSVFAIDIVLYWFLVTFLGIAPWYANLIATPFVWVYMYAIHRFFTFKSTNKPFIESARFLTIILFNTVAIPLMLYIGIDLLGFNYLLAKFVVTGIVVLWNYPIYKFWVYRK